MEEEYYDDVEILISDGESGSSEYEITVDISSVSSEHENEVLYSEEREVDNDNEGTITQHEPDDIPTETDNDHVQYEYSEREEIRNKTEDYLELDEFKNFDDLPEEFTNNSLDKKLDKKEIRTEEQNQHEMELGDFTQAENSTQADVSAVLTDEDGDQEVVDELEVHDEMAQFDVPSEFMQNEPEEQKQMDQETETHPVNAFEMKRQLDFDDIPETIYFVEPLSAPQPDTRLDVITPPSSPIRIRPTPKPITSFSERFLVRFFEGALVSHMLQFRHRIDEPFNRLRSSMHKSACIKILKEYATALIIHHQMEAFNRFASILNESGFFSASMSLLPPIVDYHPAQEASEEALLRLSGPAWPFQVERGTQMKHLLKPIMLDLLDREAFGLSITKILEAPPSGRILVLWYQYGHSRARPTFVSPLIDFYVNGNHVPCAPFKDITPLLKLGSNVLRFISVAGRESFAGLVVRIVSAKPVDVPYSGAFGSVNSKLVVDTSPTFPPIISLESERELKDKYIFLRQEPPFIDCEAILAQFAPAESDGVEIADASIAIDLRCPLSMTRIRRPVRFSTCKHLQCFDFKVFTRMLLDRSTEAANVKCPVCLVIASKKAELIECGLFTALLQHPCTRNATRIKFDLKTTQIITFPDEIMEVSTEAPDEATDDSECGVEIIISSDEN